MTDEKKTISRRKALLGIGAVGAAAAGGGAGTMAYLSDSESVGVSFEAGEFLVSVSPPNGALEFTDLDESEVSESTVDICNEGTLPVRNVKITAILFNGDTVVADALKVTSISYAGNDITADCMGSEDVSLADLASTIKNTEGGCSLTAAADSADGLSSDDDEMTDAKCRTLVITTEMDYSRLPEGNSNASLSANVEIAAEQKPIGE